jgi:hypothetical protein
VPSKCWELRNDWRSAGHRQTVNKEAGQKRPGSFAFIYPRPPLRDFTKEMWARQTQKTNPLTAIAIRGFIADFFGASPVASALDLRSGATPGGSTSSYDKEKQTRVSGHVLHDPADTLFGHVDKWLDRRINADANLVFNRRLSAAIFLSHFLKRPVGSSSDMLV